MRWSWWDIRYKRKGEVTSVASLLHRRLQSSRAFRGETIDKSIVLWYDIDIIHTKGEVCI